MSFIAIDPGPTESAYVLMEGVHILRFGKLPNQDIVRMIYASLGTSTEDLVIEKIASYGMPVGEEVFETVFWSGVFAAAAGLGVTHRITRNAVKNHLCHSSKANDGNIRQAIIDRFGGKEKAIGRKNTPGPLYGVSGDAWAALAVGLTWHDLNSGSAAA